MANITGTNGNDILGGTIGDDDIKGLGGNDSIIGGAGSDAIDGGGGNDVLDYSNLDKSSFTIRYGADGSLTVDKSIATTSLVKDKIFNIETIISPITSFFSSSIRPVDFQDAISVDVDTSKNRFTYFSPSFGSKTITIKNFNSIDATGENSRFKGSNLDDSFSSSGRNGIMFGSKGNDFLNGGINTTIDYSNLDYSVKLLPIAFIVAGSKITPFISTRQTVEKQGIGTDNVSFKKIIGTTNKKNTIDLSTANNLASMNLNLATNSLQVNAPENPGSSNYIVFNRLEVINFVNAIGGKFNDTIVGANKNSTLTGGGGNDSITGGSKNDLITGTDSTGRGVGEVDTLTGGSGRDKFVLGDKNGAYYVGQGQDDYANITDFNLFKDSIDLGGFKDYSFASGGNNTIELYSSKDVNTRDLIAKIQLTGGISSVNSNSRSIAGSSPNLDSIISKIDIVSGSES